MRLGRGWASEPKQDNCSLFANRELRMLIQKIFDTRKKDLPKK